MMLIAMWREGHPSAEYDDTLAAGIIFLEEAILHVYSANVAI